MFTVSFWHFELSSWCTSTVNPVPFWLFFFYILYCIWNHLCFDFKVKIHRDFFVFLEFSRSIIERSRPGDGNWWSFFKFLALTHFKVKFPFLYTLTTSKNPGFLTFPRVSKWNIGLKWVNLPFSPNLLFQNRL